MIRIALAAVVSAWLAGSAGAQEKPAWSAELWATEVGEELVAVVYSEPPSDEALTPALVMMCGADYWLRYDPGPGGDEAVDWEGRAATFAFDFGGEVIEHELQFEAMDAMFATTLDAGDPLVVAMRSGSEVSIALSASEGLPANSFSLEGATAALAEVRRSCR